MKKIILATTSPFRKEAFGFLGLDFITQDSKVKENFPNRPDEPKKLVLELAKRKAEAVAKNYKEGIVIGFDSVVWFNKKILEKPKSRTEAFKRIKACSGKIHYFYTGIYLIDIGTRHSLSRLSKTEITLRDITGEEINKYLNQDKNFTKIAIGFDPWGYYSASFVSHIKGSYNNYLRGIPLEIIVEMLKEIGYRVTK